MNKIQKLLFAITFSLLGSQAMAQGFSFDKELYANREKVEATRGPLPSSVSFKKYTPIIYPQENSTCLAQSYANALSILYAKNNNITDKDIITARRPSPFFIYYSNKSDSDFDCSGGLDGEKVAINILNYGVAPMTIVEYPNYYPFSSTKLCDGYPYSYNEDVEFASKNKPSNIYKIESLADIKIAIANGMPVVIGMAVPNSFINCNSYLWSPMLGDNLEDSYGHAMTIVGYNDDLYSGTFEIMNSWGESWGMNGFTRIRYVDAANWILAGWAIEANGFSNFSFDGKLEAENQDLKPNDKMIQIYSESRKDTLNVNPFFQRDDLESLFVD